MPYSPQVGGWSLWTPNLDRRKWNQSQPSALVKISTSCRRVDTWVVPMTRDLMCSQIKWQSISIYLVCSWKTGLATMCKVAWLLLQYSNIGTEKEMPRVWSKLCSHKSSLTVNDIARYSASAEEHETILCFLVCHEMRWDYHPRWQSSP